MSIVKEFQDFIARGNVIDLAVALVMGTAFNKMVTSVVTDLVMPPVGYLIAGIPFKEMRIFVKEMPAGTALDPAGFPIGEVSIKYGLFLTTVIEFLIVAITVFMMVKMMNYIISLREKFVPLPFGSADEPPAKEEPAKS